MGTVLALRLRLLRREPGLWLAAAAGLLLAALATFLGPLPAWGKGLAWRDLLFPALLFAGWLGVLGLAVAPASSLHRIMPGLPLRMDHALLSWLGGELIGLSLVCLPGLLLGLALLPQGPTGRDLGLGAVTLLQVWALGLLSALLERAPGFRRSPVPFLVGAWVAFTLPPLVWASPPGLLRAWPGPLAPLLWSLLFWAALAGALLSAGLAFIYYRKDI